MATKNRFFALVGILVAAVVIGFWGVKLREKRELSLAQAQLKRGFPDLAADTIEPIRESLVGTPQGCKSLMETYFAARNAHRLRWAGEACLYQGIQLPEVYLGLASAAEMMKQDGQALQILAATAKKFPKLAQPYFQMGQIFRRNKRDDQAMAAFKKAIALAPQNHQLQLQYLQYLASLKRWSDAKQMTDMLSGVNTNNPQVKLLLARVMLKNGDKAGAQRQLTQANELLAGRPQLKAAMEKAYSDVYKAL